MKLLHISDIKFTVEIYSENILRLLPVKQHPDASLPKLAEKLLHSKLPFIKNVTASKKELLLFTNVGVSILRKELKSITLDTNNHPNHFILPICFSKGLDWSMIENRIGVSKTGIIDKLLESSLSLCMYGFLPGFMYLDGLPEGLHMPRKTKASKRVNSGSFALGGPYAGIYNIESPAGWHVIGNCPLHIFNSKSILSPYVHIGDTFTLKKITVAEWKKLNADTLHIKDYH